MKNLATAQQRNSATAQQRNSATAQSLILPSTFLLN